MVYWNITPGEWVNWAFPRNYPGTDGNFAFFYLVVRNDVGLWEIDGELDPDNTDPEYIFLNWFNAEDDRSYPPAGEYTYELYGRYEGNEDGVLLSTGILIAGDYTPARTEYNKEIIYNQYGQTIIE